MFIFLCSYVSLRLIRIIHSFKEKVTYDEFICAISAMRKKLARMGNSVCINLIGALKHRLIALPGVKHPVYFLSL